MTIRFCPLLLILTSLAAAAAGRSVEIRPNDCAVWLGGTFAERLQSHGCLETLLTADGPPGVRFRNLGWSGDEVTGVLGSPQDGFQRLQGDLALAEPTLVLVQYGAVEAEAGPAGLPDFAANLRLLDAVASTGARTANGLHPRRLLRSTNCRSRQARTT